MEELAEEDDSLEELEELDELLEELEDLLEDSEELPEEVEDESLDELLPLELLELEDELLPYSSSEEDSLSAVVEGMSDLELGMP